jgi:ATPases involved in chromosome partitioning
VAAPAESAPDRASVVQLGEILAPDAGATGTGRRFSSYALLLDNMNALANGKPISTVVFAAASTRENVAQVIGGLAEESRRRKFTLCHVALGQWQGKPVLKTRPAGPGDEAAAIPVALRGGPLEEPAVRWFEQARSRHDLIVIEAPPLGLSLDGAMLARHCDGLVLVVEPFITTQVALRAAIQRARSTCNVLGLVVHGARDDMPRWLHQVSSPSSAS